jgi:hypothetical protein
LQQAQGEIRRVVLAREKPVKPVKGALPAGRPLAHRLSQLEQLDPGFDPHHRDFGERHTHDLALSVGRDDVLARQPACRQRQVQ